MDWSPSLLIGLLAACVGIAFALGTMTGFRMGVALAVRAELRDKGIATGLSDLQLDFIASIRDEQAPKAGDNSEPGFYQWIRKYGLPDAAEVHALYRNEDYRKAVEDQ